MMKKEKRIYFDDALEQIKKWLADLDGDDLAQVMMAECPVKHARYDSSTDEIVYVMQDGDDK